MRCSLLNAGGLPLTLALCPPEPSYETVSPMLCPPLDNCSLSANDCPYGFQQDQNGCLLCQCLSSKSPLLPQPTPASTNVSAITHEWLRSHDPLPPLLPDDSCPDLGRYCPLQCPMGYQRDDFGCEVCECSLPPPKCRPLTCSKTCPYGYV